ncbi:MAG: hypothetical protein LUC88_08900 [Prevotella sp.]|nr:hypothetical protein [Prevotella sp.]
MLNYLYNIGVRWCIMAILAFVLVMIVWAVYGIVRIFQLQGKPIDKAGEHYTPEEIETFCKHIVMDFDSPKERRRYLRSRNKGKAD